jgi:hypothetical protein
MCAKLCIPVNCSKIHDSSITVPAMVITSTGLEDLSSTVHTRKNSSERRSNGYSIDLKAERTIHATSFSHILLYLWTCRLDNDI